MSSYHMSLSLQISVQLADFGEEPPENIFFWISFFLVANVRVSASKPMVSVLTGNPGSTIQNCPCRIRSRIHRGEGNPIFYHFLRKITKWYRGFLRLSLSHLSLSHNVFFPNYQLTKENLSPKTDNICIDCLYQQCQSMKGAKKCFQLR